MSVVPKNKDGEPITDFEDYIIYENTDGTTRELKEWYAVVQYLQSFDQVDGTPQVPDYYKELKNRKVVDNNTNIFALVSHPNHISLTVYIAVPVIFALILLLMVKLIKLGKRNRAKLREKYQMRK
jgi:hypothetical protein